MVEHVELERVDASYSWADSDNVIFMNTDSYEEIIIPKKDVHNLNLLVSGTVVRNYSDDHDDYVC